MKNNAQTFTRVSNESFFSEVKNMIQAGYKVKISVFGNSMRPFLMAGDLVVLDRFEKKRLFCGDIVLAYYDKAYILHRIVGIKGNKITLTGDGNFSQVEKVNTNDILAKVINVYRKDKNIKFKDIRWKIWYKLRFFRLIYNKFSYK